MFCIDFEDNDLVSDTWGEYRPYVFNDGVTVVKDTQCPQGDRCGFFNGSGVLEVPFFSNNYGHWPSLRIELEFKMISFSGNIDQGIVSNDCVPDGTGLYAAGNSLYISANDNTFNTGLKDPSRAGPTVTVNVVSNICPLYLATRRYATSSSCVQLFINKGRYQEYWQFVDIILPMNECITLSHLLSISQLQQ